jgi:hypothetical protein
MLTSLLVLPVLLVLLVLPVLLLVLLPVLVPFLLLSLRTASLLWWRWSASVREESCSWSRGRRRTRPVWLL